MQPLLDAGLTQLGGFSLLTSLPVTVTGSGANLDGPWTVLVSGAAFEITTLQFMIANSTATTNVIRAMYTDIAVGPPGSERVIVGGLLSGSLGCPRKYDIPLRVPAGSIISARIRGVLPADALQAQLIINGGGWNLADAGHVATTYGLDPANSRGTMLTAITSGNTKSVATVIDAACANPLRWLVPCIMGPVDDTTWTSRSCLIDIGYGPSGQEVWPILNLAGSWNTAESYNGHVPTVPVSVPAGTRLVARYQCDALSGGATERPSVSLIGVH